MAAVGCQHFIFCIFVLPTIQHPSSMDASMQRASMDASTHIPHPVVAHAHVVADGHHPSHVHVLLLGGWGWVTSRMELQGGPTCLSVCHPHAKSASSLVLPEGQPPDPYPLAPTFPSQVLWIGRLRIRDEVCVQQSHSTAATDCGPSSRQEEGGAQLRRGTWMHVGSGGSLVVAVPR